MGEKPSGPKCHDALKLAKAFIRLPKLDADINKSFKLTNEFLRSLPKSKYMINKVINHQMILKSTSHWMSAQMKIHQKDHQNI